MIHFMRDATSHRERVAHVVLIIGMMLVGVVMPFASSGWTLINAAIGAIVVAEVTHYGLAVWSYRRGSHG
jgi:hypothetical protein